MTWQLAKRRAGTHKIKTRNEVARTGKKMYKQKGTGGARHGSRKAAQFVGGAKVFGPVVRSHAFDLPKKVRALALRHALSSKAKDGSLIVLDDAAARPSPRPPPSAPSSSKIGLNNALIIAGPEVDTNFKLAARNIPHDRRAAERRPQRLRRAAPRHPGADPRAVEAIEARFAARRRQKEAA